MRNYFSRRTVLAGAGATILSAARMRSTFAQAPAKYRRYNAASANGRKALRSYAKGITAMLKLPADDPRNWFRNAFIHLMDWIG